MEIKVGKREEADLVIVPCWEEGGLAYETPDLLEATALPLKLGDFKGKADEIALLYGEGPEKRVLLLGLGKKEKLTRDQIQKAYATALQRARGLKAQAINVFFPHEKTFLVDAVEALLLANESFHSLKGTEKPTPLIQKFNFPTATHADAEKFREVQQIVEGVHLARELTNQSSEVLTPEELGQCAKAIAKEYPKVKATVFLKEKIQKEGMGLLLAVNRSSKRDPAFIILEYKGAPDSDEHTVLVGKGITFDTGGLSLKPTDGMLAMRSDKGAAAAVLATVKVAAALKLRVNVTAVVPSTENCLGGESYRPGDVYKSYLGKTVHVTNTDAEGRLVLADALAYAAKNLKPTRIIDLATLTGAIVVALGEDTAAVMSDDEGLVKKLIKSGERTSDHLWRMPLIAAYRKELDSELADLKNCSGRSAGAIIAALFLREFVPEEIPWAHLDIAGSCLISKETSLAPHKSTGYGVRLLVDFLRS
ncbi:MAG: leucyl aminopeptidase [Verrucomicrobia bacterium]|nr:leucyl aminopeptidase [Verrucomicrobiota bacterium]